jgi:hypothetical protein
MTTRRVDRRGKLAAKPFGVELTGDKVLIHFRSRLVRTLVGQDADAVRRALETGDDAAVQLVVARKTGNFKRGNERGTAPPRAFLAVSYGRRLSSGRTCSSRCKQPHRIA